MERQNWVQWEEVRRGSFLINIRGQTKLVHEVVSSLPRGHDQAETDGLLGRV